MNKTSNFIENLWIVFTISSFIYAIYAVLFTEGWPAGAKNFIIPAIALTWWYIRRKMRLRVEKTMQSKQ